MNENNTVVNTLSRLETILFDGNYHDKQLYDSLNLIYEQLQQTEKQSNSVSIDEKNRLFLMLQTFEINLLRQCLIQISSKINPPILLSFFNIIRLQFILDLEANPSMSDCYFKISLIWLTHDSIINYLTQKSHSSSNEFNVDEQCLNFFCSISSRAVYYKTSGSSSMCVSRKTTPNFFELTDKTERLLRAFITYLNGHFLHDRPHTETDALILKWLLDMADIYGYIPYFIKTGYPEAILEWMKKKQNTENNKISLETWFLVVNILYNFARHLTGLKALYKFKTLEIVKEWKVRNFSSSSSIEMGKAFQDLRVAYYLLYILLLQPKEMKRETIHSIENVLDHIIERTLQAFNSLQFNCGLYNVSEYLAGLAKVVVNDKFLLYLMSKENMYDLFIQKFSEFNHLCTKNDNSESADLNALICSSLYTIFWSISFQQDYVVKLKDNDEFIGYVMQMSKADSTDEHIIAMKRAAKGILYNLDLVQTDLQPIEDNTETNDDQVKVMISYAHKDTKLCQTLVSNLQGRVRGDLWVDFIKLKPPYEDDWEEIARAITQCDVVLMLVTENYCTSKSCRREVIHADKRNKRIIPIYQGKDYQPEDWFEIRVGSATFVRFGDNKSDEKVIENLLNLIHATNKKKQPVTEEKSDAIRPSIHQHENIQHLTPNPIISLPSISSSIKTISNPIKEFFQTQSTSCLPLVDSSPVTHTQPANIKPIEQWTNVDIQQFLQLPPSILDLSSGQALLTYIRLLSNDAALNDEYESRMRHRGLSREQYANLIASLKNLHSLYNIQETSTLPPNRWTYEEIKCWFHQNHFSDYLCDIFTFTDGDEFLTYATLVTESSMRLDTEYDRLKALIQSRYNPQESFQFDEYARFISALKKLLIRSQSSISTFPATEYPAQCNIS